MHDYHARIHTPHTTKQTTHTQTPLPPLQDTHLDFNGHVFFVQFPSTTHNTFHPHYTTPLPPFHSCPRS